MLHCTIRGAAALVLALLLVLVLLVPRVAAAEPVELSGSVALDQAVDSNVYNGRGFDLVTRLAPRLGLVAKTRRLDVTAYYSLGLWWYLLGKADSTVNQRFESGLAVRLTRRLDMRLAAEVVRAQDPGFLVRAGVIAPQTGIMDVLSTAVLTYRIVRRLDAQLEYAFRITTFDPQPPPRPPLHDSNEHSLATQLAVRASRRHDFRLTGRFQYFSADEHGLATATGPSLGWRWQIRPDVELRIEGGPVYFESLRTGVIESGVTGRGVAVLRWQTHNWRASLAYAHDLVSGTGAATVLWADYVTGQLGYHVPEKLDVFAALGGFTNGEAPNGARLYAGVTVDAVVDVRVLPWLRTGAYYSFRWQEAERPPFATLVRHIAGVRVIAAFGAEARPPRRLRELPP